MKPALRIASIDKLTRQKSPWNEKGDCHTSHASFPLFKAAWK